MRLKPLTPFGVELEGFTYRTASAADREAFEASFRKYSLVLIRDTELTAQEQIQLMSRLGPVAKEVPGGGLVNYIAHDPEHILPPGTAGPAEFGQGGLNFHFDMAYTPDWPQWMASLYGVRVPTRDGHTLFRHGGRIYANLDETTKKAVAGRKAIHIFDTGRARARESTVRKVCFRSSHPLVRAHPYGGGDVLTACEQDTDRIVGMKPENSERILNELFEALANPAEVLAIQWRIGDLVIWDNRVVQHARRDFDPAEPRILRRVGCGDERMILLHMQNEIDQIHAPAVG